MAARVSESLILRTYPFGEADLIVSFFTRDSGKQRGMAKRARRPKSAYGAALERLSHSRVSYTKRETRELGSLTAAELIASPFAIATSYEIGLTLDFLAEVSEQLLPPEDPNEKFFRLLLAVIEHLRLHQDAAVWPALIYFSLWAVRLSGFLPALQLQPESAAIAEEMLLCPISKLTPRAWDKTTAADLRHQILRQIEQHVERRLFTPGLIEAL